CEYLARAAARQCQAASRFPQHDSLHGRGLWRLLRPARPQWFASRGSVADADARPEACHLGRRSAVLYRGQASAMQARQGSGGSRPPQWQRRAATLAATATRPILAARKCALAGGHRWKRFAGSFPVVSRFRSEFFTLRAPRGAGGSDDWTAFSSSMPTHPANHLRVAPTLPWQTVQAQPVAPA